MSAKTFDPNAAALPGSGIFGLPHAPEDSAVVVVPVPWEATVSYGGGASRGPAAILEASRQVDLFDRETGRPWEGGIAMLPIPQDVLEWNAEAKRRARVVIEAGGAREGDPAHASALADVEELSERMNCWVHGAARAWLARGKLVATLGGDHSAPFGAISAHAEAHPGLGILHFDAHADLREAYEGFKWSHASIMANVLDEVPEVARIVQVGIRDVGEDENARIEGDPRRLRTFFDQDLRSRLHAGEPWARLAAEVVSELPHDVYVSFDIDGLDPALCPHTGTPVPGGLSFVEATSILKTLAGSGRRIVGLDLNEVAPDPEGRSDWDANVGARMLYKMIGFALRSRR